MSNSGLFVRAEGNLACDQTMVPTAVSADVIAPRERPAVVDTGTGRGSREGARVGVTHAAAHAARVGEYEEFIRRIPVTLQNGQIIVSALGSVDTRAKYHSFKCIWPVGYSALRRFASLRTPGTETTWRCFITDGGADGPRFVLLEDGSPTPDAVSMRNSSVSESVRTRQPCERRTCTLLTAGWSDRDCCLRGLIHEACGGRFRTTSASSYRTRVLRIWAS
jgi:hypothetical protein